MSLRTANGASAGSLERNWDVDISDDFGVVRRNRIAKLRNNCGHYTHEGTLSRKMRVRKCSD